MKQIPLLQGKALLIEMPEGATNPEVHTRSLTFDTPMEVDEWGYDYQSVKLPPGNWHIVGMLSEVTESEASGLVEEQPQENDNSLPEHKRRWWKNYTGGVPFPESRALESLESSILAQGWYFENPVKIHTWASENADDYRKQWEEGKKRVLDRSRCLLLGREI